MQITSLREMKIFHVKYLCVYERIAITHTTITDQRLAK